MSEKHELTRFSNKYRRAATKKSKKYFYYKVAVTHIT